MKIVLKKTLLHYLTSIQVSSAVYKINYYHLSTFNFKFWVFDTTSHNNSIISWWSVSSVEETRVSGDHRPDKHYQMLNKYIMPCTEIDSQLL